MDALVSWHEMTVDKPAPWRAASQAQNETEAESARRLEHIRGLDIYTCGPATAARWSQACSRLHGLFDGFLPLNRLGALTRLHGLGREAGLSVWWRDTPGRWPARIQLWLHYSWTRIKHGFAEGIFLREEFNRFFFFERAASIGLT